jgi:hypothetical protein
MDMDIFPYQDAKGIFLAGFAPLRDLFSPKRYGAKRFS